MLTQPAAPNGGRRFEKVAVWAEASWKNTLSRDGVFSQNDATGDCEGRKTRRLETKSVDFVLFFARYSRHAVIGVLLALMFFVEALWLTFSALWRLNTHEHATPRGRIDGRDFSEARLAERMIKNARSPMRNEHLC